MMENEDVLVKLSALQNLSCIMYVEEKSYSIQKLSIVKSTIPVRKPTTRGGVYFTDTMAYKIKAVTQDLLISTEIPKLMLGPNTDFKPILIKTMLTVDGAEHPVTLTVHLTNAVNTKEHVELNLIVDKVDLK
ncbi:MAG TPA: hypothetical protein VJ571_07465 [Candidatus Nitrosotalea sp.]|nr:hypothetical protein [Candidatus Nitrosotalea sp.]